MIREPLSAYTLEDHELDELKYPLLATPKIDGIRCLVINGKVYSRKLKPIPNKHIRHVLQTNAEHIPTSLDGELIVEGTFQDCTSAIMRVHGEPLFTYKVFDCAVESKWGYGDRIKTLLDMTIPPNYVVMVPVPIHSKEELLIFEKACIDHGHEGIILRAVQGKYKQGRSTFNEGYLMKLKRFKDSEAVIVDFHELISEPGAVAMNTLGAIECRDDKLFPLVTFKIGSGFNDFQRAEIWDNKQKFLGKVVKYKFQECGTKDKPRILSFIGFRKD